MHKTPITKKAYLTLLTLVIAISCILLTGCGFKPRYAANPIPHGTVFYIQPSSITTAVKQQLDSAKIQTTNDKNKADIIVTFPKVAFSSTSTTLSSSTNALNNLHSLTVSMVLTDTQNNTITPTETLTAYRSQLQNSSQINLTANAQLYTNELTRDVAQRIYYWLTSQATLTLINHHPTDTKTHADTTKTT